MDAKSHEAIQRDPDYRSWFAALVARLDVVG